MTFALVTEGVSEHKIIKHILSKYFKDQEPDINQMQPRLTENEKKQEDGSIGGWVEVLKYCECESELQSIFVENEYLVIQIDTDMCEIKPFAVPRNKKSDEELYEDVVNRLKEIIPQSIKDKYLNRIIYAICINSIECWLLPVYYDNSNKCKTTNCLFYLNKVLAKNNIETISVVGDKNNSNSQKAYKEILKNLKKSDEIKTYSQHNRGFSSFINQLDLIK